MSQDFAIMRGSAGLMGQMGTMQTMNHAKMTKDIVNTIVVTQNEMSQIGRQAVATQVEVMRLKSQLPQPQQQRQLSQYDAWKEEIWLKIRRGEHLLLPYEAHNARGFLHNKKTIDLADTDDITNIIDKLNSYLHTSLSSLEEIANYAIANKKDIIFFIYESDYIRQEFEWYKEIRAFRQELSKNGVKCPVIVFSDRKGWDSHDACYNC
jgi:hypothetical protein